MATYQNFYELVGVEEKKTEMTLYEACKALIEVAKAGELNDATHVRCGGRAVAFYSEWHNSVRPMFQANQEEKTVIGEDWR